MQRIDRIGVFAFVACWILLILISLGEPNTAHAQSQDEMDLLQQLQPYSADELDTLRFLYESLTPEQLEAKKQELARRQLELNQQLNHPRNQQENRRKALQIGIRRIHQEQDALNNLGSPKINVEHLLDQYRDYLLVGGGALVMLIFFGLLSLRRKPVATVETPGHSNAESNSIPGDSDSGEGIRAVDAVSPIVIEESSSAPKPVSGIAIPLQDLQSHIDNLLLEHPNSYNSLVDLLFQQAIFWHSSDIHMQLSGGWFEVKFRIDGKLYDACVLDKYREREIINIIKVMTKLKTYEQRASQEGRLEYEIEGRWYDFRVSVVPIMNTEKVVIRIFGDEEITYDIDRLGLSIDTTEKLKTLLNRRTGLLLLVGPSGSGKTTTIYSSLNYVNKITGGVSIISLEDPVEHILPGVTQVQINPDKNLTFESGFANLLRQDPEVLMIGEIRETNVAKLAIQATQTGHLVISTVHSPTTLGAVDRMMNLGVDSYSLHSLLVGVLSQRLVRSVCVHCLQPYDPDPELVKKAIAITGLRDMEWRHGVGCEQCLGRGFHGRIVLDELLVFSNKERDALMTMENRAERRNFMMERINHSLWADGIAKAAAGLTTLEEVFTVVDDNTI